MTTPSSPSALRTVTLGTEETRLPDIIALAEGKAQAELLPAALERMQASYDLVQNKLSRGEKIYGVTTGYGHSVKNPVAPTSSATLSLNLLRFHGCGTGRLLTPTESAAVLACRLCSLLRGGSGVRPEVATRICLLLNKRLFPAIPAEGSVGASGDLTPLSYLAAVLVGERELLATDGQTRPAAEVFAEHGIEPLTLGPKEALALMNGTSVASALGVLALHSAGRLARLTARITALASWSILGNPEHFDSVLHGMKAHPGQILAAEWIRGELAQLPAQGESARLQDRYSIRCTPQILGVLIDALNFFEGVLTTEINSVTDNPIVDVEGQRIVHGGNFYGGHVVFAMDGLKAAVANIADLLDRQLILLCQPGESAELAENLVGVRDDTQSTHHGFKAMSIAASALTAEALKQAVPASIFSRSTESHNQDKVPMATMGARDALRVIELTEQIAAVCTLAACQAAWLRSAGAAPGALCRRVRDAVAPLLQDRRMDRDIDTVLALIRSGELDGTTARPV